MNLEGDARAPDQVAAVSFRKLIYRAENLVGCSGLREGDREPETDGEVLGDVAVFRKHVVQRLEIVQI